ncbi:MAG: hypothetical protein AABZ47_03480 [Planctomycetota bacterium]
MSQLLHVCVFNTDPEASSELLGPLQSLNFVRMVPEVSTADELAQALQEYEVNLIVFHLDPVPAPIIDVIDQVATRYPTIATIAISSRTGPNEILAPMRAGCDQFVCKPIDQGDLASAVGRVASKRLLGRTQGRCICVTSASGGAGATSIACNLALEIGQLTDTECALFDLDLQFGDVALNFDTEPEYSLFELAEAGTSLDRSLLTRTLTKLPAKVSLLTRPQSIDQCEAITPDLIHRVIQLLTASHENVIVDVPRRFDSTTFAAMKQADLVFIVCQLLVPSIRHAQRYRDTMVRFGIPADRIEFIVNRFDQSTKGVQLNDLAETFQKPIYATVPNDYQFVARCLDLGRPVAAVDRSSAVRVAIRKFARRITSDTTSESKKNLGEKKGFLSKLFS